MSRYEYFRDLPFDLAGPLDSIVVNGVKLTDATGYTAVARLAKQSTPMTPFAEIPVVWLNPVGLIALVRYDGDTLAWPAGIASLRIIVTSPEGLSAPSQEVLFEIR